MTCTTVSTSPAVKLPSTPPEGPLNWRQYSTKLCQDICWVISSPDLMQGTLRGYKSLSSVWYDDTTQTDLSRWLGQLDLNKNPEPRGKDRLGRYFEALLAFIFQNAQPAIGLKLITQNIQIQSQGKTLGELDFLLEDTKGCLLHLEVAIKYYLLERNVSDPSRWEHWVGPDRKDRLDIKLNHLVDRQLPLTKRYPEARSAIAQLLTGETSTSQKVKSITSMLLLKGRFFIHWNDAYACPIGANNSAVSGYWLTQSEIDYLYRTQLNSNASTDELIFLEKLEWITGQAQKPRTTPVSSAPYMVRLKTDGSQWVLVIVVPDYWAAINSPSRSI